MFKQTKSSKNLFHQRQLYDMVLEASVGKVGEDNLIDLLGIKRLYGRVDRFGRSIMPRKGLIGKFGEGSRAFALNAVIEAFQKMQGYFVRAGYRINHTDTLLTGLEAKGGWNDPVKLYETVRNIASKAPSVDVPFTLETFMRGNYASVFNSGLAFTIVIKDCNDDTTKFNKFYNDANFPFYKEAARKFGFYVNKHTPWCLMFRADDAFIAANFEPAIWYDMEMYEPDQFLSAVAKERRISLTSEERTVILGEAEDLMRADGETAGYQYIYETLGVGLDS